MTTPLTVAARSARHGGDRHAPGVLICSPTGRLWVPLGRAHELADALVDVAETLEHNGAAADAWAAQGRPKGAA